MNKVLPHNMGGGGGGGGFTEAIPPEQSRCFILIFVRSQVVHLYLKPMEEKKGEARWHSD